MTTDRPRPGLSAALRVRRGDLELDLEVEVAAGETLALVGPNGAGKTTVVEVLAGLLALHDGHVRLGDRTLDDPDAGVFVPPERRRVGVVFQHHLLFDHLDARANVAFGLRAGGADRRSADRTADDWLAALDVADLADRRPGQLSGGQAQRVALARTLAVDPDLLLLDEPLAALDVQTRIEVRRVLGRHLRSSPRPTVLISHDPEDALLLADRLAVIEHGRLTQIGTPEEVRRHPASRYVAALAGTNLVAGRARDGAVTCESDAAPTLQIADHELTGDVLCSIRPEAVSVHLEEPSGSQRNVWRTTVELVEPTGDTVRVIVGDPLPLAVDITAGSAATLGLAPGSPVWVAVKATEIDTHPV